MQGVGYRDFARRQAQPLGLTGYVRNLPRPDLVEVEAEGPRGLLEEFLGDLRRGPSGASVSDVDVVWEPARGEFASFTIRG